ncbi:MAG TPA: DUF4911 domain-containing protein [Candidatus Cloacimonetes bacterium]|nr:DUF4911 domain-containing protein [Candidatus Cloacimonadota bacterium]
MNFKILKESFLVDKTKRILIKIPSDELMYFGYFIEGFEGWCNYTTPDKNESVLQVDIAPDFVEEFGIMLQFMRDWEL